MVVQDALGKTEFKNTNKSQVESGNFHIILPAPACRNVVIGENQNCEKIIGKDDSKKFMKDYSKSEINIPLDISWNSLRKFDDNCDLCDP